MTRQMPLPDAAGRWPVWKLAVLVYVPSAGAAAVNLFFVGLLLQALGLPPLGPWASVVGGMVLGLPLAWVAGRWFRRMIDTAEGHDPDPGAGV